MEESMTLIDRNGKEVKCELIAVFTKNDNNYIVYTDGTIVDGEKETLASKYIWRDRNKIELHEIESEEEWKLVEDFLKNELLDEAEYEEI